MEILSANRSSQEYADYPLHQHGYWEIIFSLKGQGEIRINDEIYPFHEGTVFAIPPMTPHCKKAKDRFVDGCMFASNVVFPKEGVLIVEDDIHHTLCTLFEMAYAVQQRGEPNSQKIIDALGDAVYQIMLGACTVSGERNEIIDRFQQVLIDNLSNCNFDIGEAIEATGYNLNYFRRLFREQVGCTPLEYFTQLRIEHAKRLLKQYSQVRSIAEIARESGFSDPYYFSRKFKQLEAMSPREYVRGMGETNYEMLVRPLADAQDDPESQIRRQR